MKPEDRVQRWIADLDAALDQAAALVARGRRAYDTDSALPLAFEALATRVGEIVNRLVSAEPRRFDADVWRQAARNRDFVVHHDVRVDRALLWRTVAVSFPALRAQSRRLRDGERDSP